MTLPGGSPARTSSTPRRWASSMTARKSPPSTRAAHGSAPPPAPLRAAAPARPDGGERLVAGTAAGGAFAVGSTGEGGPSAAGPKPDAENGEKEGREEDEEEDEEDE